MRLLLYIMSLLVAMSTLAAGKIDYDEQAGKAIYEQYCALCHREGLVGAPLFRDEKAWKPRTANKDLDALVASATQGLNAMPQKGTCTTCSETDLKNAIQYMLPQS